MARGGESETWETAAVNVCGIRKSESRSPNDSEELGR